MITNNYPQLDGSGFGLSIVERIVQAHGWDVTLNEGTAGRARFEITDVDIETPRRASETDTPVAT